MISSISQKRRLFTHFYVVACLLTYAGICLGAEKRPNILFLRTDDQGLWAMGINNPEVITPNMDRIHREGVHFTNAFVTTPVCSPSRAAVMSGLYGIETGITEWIHPTDMDTGIDPDYVTWPEAVDAAGYMTGLIGKWHLGNTDKYHPTEHGFDYFMGMIEGGTHPMKPDLEVHRLKRNLPGTFMTDFLGDDGVHFIRQNKDIPFLLMVDFRAPHGRYDPIPEVYSDQYRDADITVPTTHEYDHEFAKDRTRAYYAAITAVDHNIGRMLDTLEELNIADNTIVVFTSDHGYMIGHHGLWHKGNGFYFDSGKLKLKDPERRRPNMFDNSIRVPLAIRWPARIKAGSKVDKIVIQQDLYPTMLDLAGIEMVDLPEHQQLRGKSLSGLINGKQDDQWRDTIFGEYDMSNGKQARMRMIRTPEWKLVKHYEEANAEDELYDLKSDPGELNNLYEGKLGTDLLEKLETRLVDWQKSISDPLLN